MRPLRVYDEWIRWSLFLYVRQGADQHRTACSSLWSKVISPKLSDFKSTTSIFTYSTFIGTSGNAASCTADGDIILWSNTTLNNLTLKLETGKKAATKCIKLHGSGINYATVVADKYFITGGADGIVKVFDLKFKALFWYEKLHAGGILTVAISLNSESKFN
jgi:cilia- and flagella-associated protein 251